LVFGKELKTLQPAEVATSTDQPLETQPASTNTVEISTDPAKEGEKNSIPTAEAAPVTPELIRLPIRLPVIEVSDQPVTLTPLYDPQLLLSEGEIQKLWLVSVMEEQIPLPPPAAQSTRPRRVLNPKSQNSDSGQSSQTEPTRLQRPPASSEPTRLRRPPAQNKPPSNQQ
jgi:hypothetical protein